MAAFFDSGSGSSKSLAPDIILQLLGDGIDSEVEGLDENDELMPQIPCSPLPPPQPSPIPICQPLSQQPQRRNAEAVRRRRLWKQVPFNQKDHNYPQRRPTPIRSPLQYFEDYFDTEFFELCAMCTNNYYMRKTGCTLNTNTVEIKKLIGIHLIMGCIPYPRLHMYWRDDLRFEKVANVMGRERFKTLRSALHVVDNDFPLPGNKNSLWKVQPIISKVKQTCDRLERQPGFYSIDEQMIPFSGLCPRGLRQVIKTKPRPQGLKVFVATTHDGLMIDFEVYRGADTPIGDRSLGVGASVILHLSQTIPPGSCICFDRYFTSIPLLEKLNSIGLHGTGTIMMNRIPDRNNIDFKQDRRMHRGESQQFVCDDVVVVKWMDNKSVLTASNCTSADDLTSVRRWDKNRGAFIDVTAPKIIDAYNKHMGGVDVVDQSIEYYRTFMKTRKWTLKVILHFFDLAVSNAWRLYKLECQASAIPSNKVMDLLEFRMQIADGLTNTPIRQRRTSQTEESGEEVNTSSRYRRSNQPSQAKRYDGYDHLPSFEEIDNPRACRFEGCKSRSKIRCKKCDVYLCLSRKQNCFAAYHVK